MSTNVLRNAMHMVSRDLLPTANSACMRRKERHFCMKPAAYGAAWSSTSEVTSQHDVVMWIICVLLNVAIFSSSLSGSRYKHILRVTTVPHVRWMVATGSFSSSSTFIRSHPRYHTYAVVRLRRGSEIAHATVFEDLIFDRRLYLGKVFGRPPDVELDSAR